MFKRYGMCVHTIKKVKTHIYNNESDIEISVKLNLTEGQIDFVRNILCKGHNRVQDRRIGKLESDVSAIKSFSIGSQVYSKDEEFGVGVVIQLFEKEFEYTSFTAKFTHRRYPTLCSIDKHGKMTTSPDGTVRVLKRLS